MILEELLGGILSLLFNLAVRTPPISRENLQGLNYSLIFDENPERDEANGSLIHHEYEEAQVTELPYYEENISVWGQDDVEIVGRNFYVSFRRSCKANFGIMMAAIFVLGFLIVGFVFLNLNTYSACIEWIQNNLKVPRQVQVLQMVGMCICLIAVMTWFPASIAMLWGFKDFKKNYLYCLCAICFLTTTVIYVYKIVMFDKIKLTDDNIYL